MDTTGAVIIVVLIVLLVYYYMFCNDRFRVGYGKFFVKTWLLPILLPSLAGTIISFVLFIKCQNSVTNIIGGFFYACLILASPLFFVFNLLYYHIIKWLKSDKIKAEEAERIAMKERQAEQQRKEREQQRMISEQQENAKREQQEIRALENDDMREINSILASIPEKTKAFNNFTNELQAKIVKLKGFAANAIANAYGEYSNGNNDITRYNELKNRHSSGIDPILAAQCDKIIKRVSDNIAQKEQSIKKNAEDIQKYSILTQNLHKEYDRELKIEKMKKISGQLSEEIATSEEEFATSSYNGYSVENAIADFKQLNIAMEERRNLEIQFGQIDI